jgi:hypothetical protein
MFDAGFTARTTTSTASAMDQLAMEQRFDLPHSPEPPGGPHFADRAGPLDPALVELLSGEREPSLARVAREVQKTTWLAREVIRAANAVLYGMSKRVNTVEWALRVIGLNRLRRIIANRATTWTPAAN